MAVGLVLWLAILGTGGQTVARAATTSTAPPVSVAPAGGSACFVGLPECSQDPCVTFVAGPQSAVLDATARQAPGSRVARPAKRCRKRNPTDGVGVSQPITSATPAVIVHGAAPDALARRPPRRLR